MTPAGAARLLLDELREALNDLEHTQIGVQAVHPPGDLGPDTCFHVTLSSESHLSLEVELPTNLALGYLADEEAAVDEWRLWVSELPQRLRA